MARIYLIIDGYNLLHAAGLGRRRHGPGDLERARQRLVAMLQQRLDAGTLSDTTLVFDAPARQEVEGESGQTGGMRTERGGLTICYSAGGRDADAEIERMLGLHSSPGQVLVVSGDHRLHKAAGGRRATCLDSEKFLELLESANPGAVLRGLSGVRRPRVGRMVATRAETVEREKPVNWTDLEQEFLEIDVEGISKTEKSRGLGRLDRMRNRWKKR
jgi:predicted RNA-binding protein with PIN domain